MPFGFKTAPPIFQRKMDEIFREYKRFILVYVDDILVFSKDMQEHLGHLQIIFRLFVNKGIIISKKKMELYKFFRSNFRRRKDKVTIPYSEKSVGYAR